MRTIDIVLFSSKTTTTATMSSSQRPEGLDLRSKSQASVSRPLRSPRMHVAGEAPPELSPLDAFALQSRLLAKQLEDSAKKGRRMSRLPPLTVESPLIVQARSDYFRSLSQDSVSDDDHAAPQNVGLGLKTEVEDDLSNRPRSMHPRLSQVPPTPDDTIPVPAVPRTNFEAFTARHPGGTGTDEGFFGVGARRERSPSPVDASRSSGKTVDIRSAPVADASITSSPERLAKNSFDAAGLVPPRPMFTKRSSSLMSSHHDFTDEEGLSTLSTSIHSQSSRKFSASSGILSPPYPSYHRSPSVASDASGLPRPQFNFSRPLSRAGTPSFDLPTRQLSSDSQGSFIPADDLACTPVSTTSDTSRDLAVDDGISPAPSYIYSKFSLPRGKALQRSSIIMLNEPSLRPSLDQPSISMSHTQGFPGVGQPPPSPPSRPSSSGGSRSYDGFARPSQERSKLGTEVIRPMQQPSPNPSRPSTDSARGSFEEHRGRSLTSHIHDAAAGKSPGSTATSDSASTIKAGRSIHTAGGPTMSDLSAEEHVSKAIALHENGSLQESTWHLRHAAKQGHPTGMLLYALACRHGWGMRPNPREGVQWLRKAADSASLEIADDEGQAREGKPVDVAERKTRKAQFALSIYELGVSHMNGWGIEQDKGLALRCFEIAACKLTAHRVFCYLITTY